MSAKTQGLQQHLRRPRAPPGGVPGTALPWESVISDESPPSRPAAALVATPGLHEHASRVLVAVAIVALVAVLAYLRGVVVLAFGSVLVAVALRMGSNGVRHATGLGDAAALAVAVLATWHC